MAARDTLARKGITLLDCPLSGTGAQARTKDLLVYASGPRAACNACKEVFAGFARAHYYLGAFGTGIKMKFIANLPARPFPEPRLRRAPRLRSQSPI